MAPPGRPTRRGPDLVRRASLVFSLLVALASLLAYWHAVRDGPVALADSWSLRRVVAVDPLATAWFPALCSFLVAVGLLTRSSVSWAGLSVLAIYAVFFLPQPGWLYVGAVVLMAMGLAWLRPRRAPATQETP